MSFYPWADPGGGPGGQSLPPTGKINMGRIGQRPGNATGSSIRPMLSAPPRTKGWIRPWT